jgi:hypothetical protein
VRLMNSTPAEFRRALIQAFGPAVSDDAAGLLLAADGVQLHFALERQDPQRIGALQLECLTVRISSCEGDDAAADKLLAKVDRATLRGGG